MIVSSPRYLMPPDQILSTFPPAMAEGDFGGRLPQIALKRRTLPWERDPGGPALDADDPPRPWLALVVIAEGEGALSPDPVPVAECVTPGTVLPAPGGRRQPDRLLPDRHRDGGEQGLPDRGGPAAARPRARGRHPRHRAGQRRRRRLAGRRPRQPAADRRRRRPIPNTGQPVSAPVRYLACLSTSRARSTRCRPTPSSPPTTPSTSSRPVPGPQPRGHDRGQHATWSSWAPGIRVHRRERTAAHARDRRRPRTWPSRRRTPHAAHRCHAR